MPKNQYRRPYPSRLFIIAGNESSGKDDIISAVQSLGVLHAEIIPKYTTRKKQLDDGAEIICRILSDGTENPEYVKNIKKCDIEYVRKEHRYSINSKLIWDGLKSGLFQVISVSEAEAINKLIKKFGSAIVLIYVHSHSNESTDELKLFVNNFNKFDHVLINEGIKEDLYDQLFRLFRAYEKGLR